MGAYPFYAVVDKHTDEVVSVHMTRREASRSKTQWSHRVRGVHGAPSGPLSALRKRLARKS